MFHFNSGWIFFLYWYKIVYFERFRCLNSVRCIFILKAQTTVDNNSGYARANWKLKFDLLTVL